MPLIHAFHNRTNLHEARESIWWIMKFLSSCRSRLCCCCNRRGAPKMALSDKAEQIYICFGGYTHRASLLITYTDSDDFPLYAAARKWSTVYEVRCFLWFSCPVCLLDALSDSVWPCQCMWKSLLMPILPWEVIRHGDVIRERLALLAS